MGHHDSHHFTFGNMCKAFQIHGNRRSFVGTSPMHELCVVMKSYYVIHGCIYIDHRHYISPKIMCFLSWTFLLLLRTKQLMMKHQAITGYLAMPKTLHQRMSVLHSRFFDGLSESHQCHMNLNVHQANRDILICNQTRWNRSSLPLCRKPFGNTRRQGSSNARKHCT